jgi:hypothetical protein
MKVSDYQTGRTYMHYLLVLLVVALIVCVVVVQKTPKI